MRFFAFRDPSGGVTQYCFGTVRDSIAALAATVRALKHGCLFRRGFAYGDLSLGYTGVVWLPLTRVMTVGS